MYDAKHLSWANCTFTSAIIPAIVHSTRILPHFLSLQLALARMKYQTDDLRITGMEEAIAPATLIDELPISKVASQRIFSTREQISDILADDDQRLLVIMGPCSIHDPKAAIEYAERLAVEAERYCEDLCLVMRVYFEKPRTTVGWKGLINDPNLNNSYDINQGLRTARGLLRDIVELGLGTGTEYL